MRPDLEGLDKEINGVRKRQKTCETVTQNAIDTILGCLKQIKAQMESTGQLDSNSKAAIASCVKTQLTEELSKPIKEYAKAVNNLQKAAEKGFEQDISKAARDVELDRATLDLIIAEHLYREGRFEAGALLAKEANLANPWSIRDAYQEMHKVLGQLRNGSIDAALEWVERHREKLQPNAHVFEFKLHRTQFLRLLVSEGQLAALEYSKSHLSRFCSAHPRQFARLMGCLLFAGRPFSETPYAELQEAMGTEEITHDFIRNCCGLMGQAYESPLLVSVAAGSAALPHLLKCQNRVLQPGAKTWQQDLRTCRQLPLEIDIGREFHFHSIFACPVSKSMSTAENPPQMLPCGHVLCSDSVLAIAKGVSCTFKCPYCPTETTPGNCRVLVFPDVE